MSSGGDREDLNSSNDLQESGGEDLPKMGRAWWQNMEKEGSKGNLGW